MKTEKYEDLKTDEDFDRWYGRKPGWKDCEHVFVSTKDKSVWDAIYKTVQCTKCGVADRA